MFELTQFFYNPAQAAMPVISKAARFSSADSTGIDSDSADKATARFSSVESISVDSDSDAAVEESATESSTFDLLTSLRTHPDPSGILRLKHIVTDYQAQLKKESAALLKTPYFQRELHYIKMLLALLKQVADILPKLGKHHPIKDTLKLRLLRVFNMICHDLNYGDMQSPLCTLVKSLHRQPEFLVELNIDAVFPKPACAAGYDLLLSFETHLIQANIHHHSYQSEHYDKKGFNQALLDSLRIHRHHLMHLIEMQEKDSAELKAKLMTALVDENPTNILKLRARLTLLEKRSEFYDQEKLLIERIILNLKSITVSDAAQGEALQELLSESFDIGRNTEERLPKVYVSALERLAAHLNADLRFQSVYALSMPSFDRWAYDSSRAPRMRAA